MSRTIKILLIALAILAIMASFIACDLTGNLALSNADATGTAYQSTANFGAKVLATQLATTDEVEENSP